MLGFTRTLQGIGLELQHRRFTDPSVILLYSRQVVPVFEIKQRTKLFLFSFCFIYFLQFWACATLTVDLSLGRPPGQGWRRRPGCPRSWWLDQLRTDKNTPPADLWRRATSRGQLSGDATVHVHQRCFISNVQTTLTQQHIQYIDDGDGALIVCAKLLVPAYWRCRLVTYILTQTLINCRYYTVSEQKGEKIGERWGKKDETLFSVCCVS